jgi:hypothetical protein
LDLSLIGDCELGYFGLSSFALLLIFSTASYACVARVLSIFGWWQFESFFCRFRWFCSVAPREPRNRVPLDGDLDAPGGRRDRRHTLTACLGNRRLAPFEPHLSFSPSVISFALHHSGGEKQFHKFSDIF